MANRINNMKDQTKTSRMKDKSNKNLLALFLIVLILLLSVVIILIQFPFMAGDSKADNQETDRVDGNVAFALDPNEAVNFYPLSKNLVLNVTKAGIEILNLKGEREYNIEIPLTKPEIAVKGDKYLAIELQGFQYIVFDNNDLIYHGKMEAPIIGYDMDNNGNLVVLTENEGTKGVASIFNNTGQLQFQITYQDEKESGFAIAAKLAADSKSVYVSLINTAGSAITPIINEYSLESQNLSRLIGQYKPQIDSPLPLVFPHNGSSLILAGAKNLLLLDAEKVVDIPRLNTFFNGGEMADVFYFVGALNESGPYYLNFVNKELPTDLEHGYRFNHIPREIHASSNFVALLVDDSLYRFTKTNPTNPDIFNMQGKVIRFGIDEHGDILAICSDGVRKIIN